MDDVSKQNNRILYLLCLCLIMGVLNFLAMTPFYPEVSSDLGVSISLLGQVVTFMVLLSAVLGLAIGPIVDRCGYRLPLTIGVCCVAINVTGAGLAPSFPWLLSISLVGGLADALTFGIPFAIVGVIFSPDDRKRALSWLVGSMSVGGIIGIPLLTVLGSATSWRVAMIALGGIAVCIAVLTLIVIPKDRRRSEIPWSFHVFTAAYAPVLGHASTVRLLTATAIRSICWLGVLTYLGAYLGQEHDLSTKGIGLVYTIGATGYAFGSSIAGRLIGRVAARIVVGIMCVVTALATVAAGFAINVGFAVGSIVVMAMASAVIAIGVTLLLSTESLGEQGTTMLLNGSMVNFGGAAGAAIGGGLIAMGGYQAFGLGLSAFSLLGAVLVLWPQRRERDVHTPLHPGVATEEPETAASI
ncbi:MAG: MFS transporter [Thermomicrobiales bacterium]